MSLWDRWTQTTQQNAAMMEQFTAFPIDLANRAVDLNTLTGNLNNLRTAWAAVFLEQRFFGAKNIGDLNSLIGAVKKLVVQPAALVFFGHVFRKQEFAARTGPDQALPHSE